MNGKVRARALSQQAKLKWQGGKGAMHAHRNKTQSWELQVGRGQYRIQRELWQRMNHQVVSISYPLDFLDSFSPQCWQTMEGTHCVNRMDLSTWLCEWAGCIVKAVSLAARPLWAAPTKPSPALPSSLKLSKPFEVHCVSPPVLAGVEALLTLLPHSFKKLPERQKL